MPLPYPHTFLPIFCLSATLVLALPAAHALALEKAPSSLSGAVEIIAPPPQTKPRSHPTKKRAPVVPSAAQPWQFPCPTPSMPDMLWKRGISHTLLEKKAAPRTPTASAKVSGVDTHDSIQAALDEARKKNAAQPKLGLRRGVTDQPATWRNPVTEPVRVGEEIVLERKRVFGAYADIPAGEDVTLSAGPELTINAEQGMEHLTTSRHSDPNSNLGVGVQLQWAF